MSFKKSASGYKATIKPERSDVYRDLRNNNLKDDLLKEIFEAYASLTHDLSYGVRIDDLWKVLIKRNPEISFNDFEKQLLELIHGYIENVTPSEGISTEKQKIIYDPFVYQGKYFHYIRFSPKIINSMLSEPESKHKIYWDGKRRINILDHEKALELMDENTKNIFSEETTEGKLKIVKWVLAWNSIPLDWHFKWRIKRVAKDPTLNTYHLQFERESEWDPNKWRWLHYEDTLKWMKIFLS